MIIRRISLAIVNDVNWSIMVVRNKRNSQQIETSFSDKFEPVNGILRRNNDQFSVQYVHVVGI